MDRRERAGEDSTHGKRLAEARPTDTSAAADATPDADVQLSSVLDAVAARLDEVLEAPAAHDAPSAPSRPDGVRDSSDLRLGDGGGDEVRGGATERGPQASRVAKTPRQVNADGEADRRSDAPRPTGTHVPWILISLTSIVAGALLVLLSLL